jgi:hypothetical protein
MIELSKSAHMKLIILDVLMIIKITLGYIHIQNNYSRKVGQKFQKKIQKKNWKNILYHVWH